MHIGFAQFDGPLSDSLYKVNKVRTMRQRYADYGLKNYTLTVYDKDGKLLRSTMFDSKGEKKWLESVFEYDGTGKLKKTVHCSYMNHDKVTGRDKPDSLLDSSKVNILYSTYDAAGRLIRTKGTLGPDKTASELSFYYDPLISVWKFHRLNEFRLTTLITEYEKPGIAKSTFQSYDSGRVTANTWQELYQNSFDQSGRLIKRITTHPSDPSFSSETFYEYNDRGLLAKRYTRYRGGKKDCDTNLYDYTYWDDCEPGSVALIH